MLKVLGLGDSMVSKYIHIRAMYPGGDTLNFTVYAEMSGTEADYLGTFRDDETTAHVYSTVRGLGLGLSYCRFYPGENGYTEVRPDDGGRVFIDSNRSGVSREHPLELTTMDRAYIAGYDIIHTSTSSYIEDELPLLRQVLSFVSMDFSDGVDEKYLRQCAPYVNCASISCGDMSRSGVGKQIALVRKFEYRHIAIATRGTREALVVVDGCLYEQSPCLVEVVDTMRAGDSFIACFLINYMDAMRGSRDFPAVSGTKGTAIATDYQDLIVGTSLYRTAVYSTSNCQKDGSFGFGKVFQNE